MYEAEQQSLGRHVAVKVLPRQSLLDDHRLERFEREARTAARLHHTNIVPIFGVGENRTVTTTTSCSSSKASDWTGSCKRTARREAQVRERVAGASDESFSALAKTGRQRASAWPGDDRGPPADRLRVRKPVPPANSDGLATRRRNEPSSASAGTDARSRSNPFWHERRLRVGLQVADALALRPLPGHAASRHQTRQPPPRRSTGIVWVTDFGLAKAMEDSNQLTNSGDVVGTLQYMAPEQFCGDYDERSDIYCLGLTLYELLTLQPAHQGSNRSGLIHKVTQGLPIRPRRIEPGIPADLETIVLKAISRDPVHRYQTATELRDDLQRYLEDRPILARRVNVGQRMWRWCRRNKSLAGSLGVAIAAILAATLIAGCPTWRSRSCGRETTAVNTRIRENLELQRQFFERIFQRLVGPDMFQSMIRVDAATATGHHGYRHQRDHGLPERVDPDGLAEGRRGARGAAGVLRGLHAAERGPGRHPRQRRRAPPSRRHPAAPRPVRQGGQGVHPIDPRVPRAPRGTASGRSRKCATSWARPTPTRA